VTDAMPSNDLAIRTQVLLPDGKIATVKFRGPTSFAPGLWLGLELGDAIAFASGWAWILRVRGMVASEVDWRAQCAFKDTMVRMAEWMNIWKTAVLLGGLGQRFGDNTASQMNLLIMDALKVRMG
jgi:hypothetical protein